MRYNIKSAQMKESMLILHTETRRMVQAAEEQRVFRFRSVRRGVEGGCPLLHQRVVHGTGGQFGWQRGVDSSH